MVQKFPVQVNEQEVEPLEKNFGISILNWKFQGEITKLLSYNILLTVHLNIFICTVSKISNFVMQNKHSKYTVL